MFATKRAARGMRWGLGLLTAFGLVCFGGNASAQPEIPPEVLTSSSTLGCLPPEIAAELLVDIFFGEGEAPDNPKICEKVCEQEGKLCKNAAQNNHECMKRVAKDGKKVGGTECKDEDSSEEQKMCKEESNGFAGELKQFADQSLGTAVATCNQHVGDCKEGCNGI